ncbi:MAG: RHS repeat protein [Rhodocyclales bacterium]|nr:RHS repeat protein [Rhodocyclales bacterium]
MHATRPLHPDARLAPLALALGLAFAAGPLLAQSPVTTYEYDAVGNRTKVTSPLSRITLMGYDALNRLKQTIDPAGGVVQMGYDALDRLVSVTDPRNLVTTYQYNGLGDLVSQTSPDTGTTQNVYDAAGNLTGKTDAKGQATAYQYDALNRTTLVTHADGSQVRTTYDQGSYGIGRVRLIEELTGGIVTASIQYGYDPLGRVTSETRTLAGVAYATAYGYANGRLVSVTYPSGRRIDYTHDGLGRISQVQLTENGQVKVLASNIQYQPFGGVKSFINGAGQAYTRSFDQDGRVASYSLGSQTWLVGYDAASRITYQTDAGNAANTASYGYDAADRLTSAVLPATNLGYTYDATGNRSSQTIGGTTRTYTTAPASNRLTAIDSGPPKSYTFDANGAITGDGLNTFGYDARGRMTSAVTAAGTTQYRVNALGQRARKTNAAEDVLYLYDRDGRLLAESSPAGQIQLLRP